MKSSNESKYKSKNPIKRFLLDKFLEQISSIILEKRADNLLDVGCGEGFLFHFLDKQKISCNFTGVDISQPALKKAKKRFNKANYTKASIYQLPFKNRSFDIVLCLEVLEHLKNPKKALQEILRVSKKTCLISVPHEPYFSLLRFIALQDILKFGKHNEHIQFWTKGSFLRFVKEYTSKVYVRNSFPWLVVEVRNQK